MKPPSTSWREEVDPTEAERFASYAKDFAEVQRRRSERYGTGRALHRKQIAGLEAELEVLADLPEHARQGLFARAGKHPARLRLSNGGMEITRDGRPDVRGYAIKVLGVEGPGALGNPTSSQDFALINHPTFSSPKSAQFVGLVLAASRGAGAALRYLFKTYGFFGGLKQARRAAGIFKRPFSGFATERFYSAAPIACGPYAARVRLLPASDRPSPNASADWAADLRERLAAGPLVHELQLQFFVDEGTTPIEDASVDWPEAEAPYLTVARLTIPKQAVGGEAGKKVADEVERDRFDPWNALVEHRPLGDVMRARKVAYFASQKGRGAHSA